MISGQSTGTLEAGFEYRVTLNQFDNMGVMENVLRCDVAGDPQVVDHSREYIFSVGKRSLGDANDDGTVNFLDLTSVSANWATTDCLTQGDADRDGVVGFADNTAVINNWLNTYTGCDLPCLENPASAGGSTPPSPCDRTMAGAIKAMGVRSAREFSAWFSDLAPDEQNLVLTGIHEWLNCRR